MTVNSISLNNYRNIESVNIFPSDGVNVIYGQNAQGKTNILEGIWLFTGCKSFRGAKDADLIKFGSEYLKNSISFTDNSREKTAEIIIGKEKKVRFNGIDLKSSSELIGEFYAVIFSPSHLSLIKDGPSERRKFLDIALCELKPSYAGNFKCYRRALLQRNALLKDLKYSSQLYDILDAFDDQLARYAAVIVSERFKYTSLLSEYCEEIYAGISENKEKLSVKYSAVDSADKNMSVHDLYLLYLDRIRENKKEDIFLKTSTTGPHRDDIEILIDNISARSFGSQGQQRSAALSLKLAEAEIIKKITGETPVALLDDVMSELDEKRQDYVLNHIMDRQVFITCCDVNQISRQCGGKVFYTENGKTEEQ